MSLFILQWSGKPEGGELHCPVPKGWVHPAHSRCREEGSAGLQRKRHSEEGNLHISDQSAFFSFTTNPYLSTLMLKSQICPKCLCQRSHFSMLQEIKGLREELSTRLNSSDTMEIIKEKEEQIRGLLEEGKTNINSRLLFFTSTEPHNSTLDRLYSQENVKHEANCRLGLA